MTIVRFSLRRGNAIIAGSSWHRVETSQRSFACIIGDPRPSFCMRNVLGYRNWSLGGRTKPNYWPISGWNTLSAPAQRHRRPRKSTNRKRRRRQRWRRKRRRPSMWLTVRNWMNRMTRRMSTKRNQRRLRGLTRCRMKMKWQSIARKAKKSCQRSRPRWSVQNSTIFCRNWLINWPSSRRMWSACRLDRGPVHCCPVAMGRLAQVI